MVKVLINLQDSKSVAGSKRVTFGHEWNKHSANAA